MIKVDQDDEDEDEDDMDNDEREEQKFWVFNDQTRPQRFIRKIMLMINE